MALTLDASLEFVPESSGGPEEDGERKRRGKGKGGYTFFLM